MLSLEVPVNMFFPLYTEIAILVVIVHNITVGFRFSAGDSSST